MTCVGQVEKNDQCIAVLENRFPGVPKYRELLTFAHEWDGHADVFAFGDPCPKHSRARSNGESNHPDLSGYCLALVGRFRPWGVVRENVPAPTVVHFAACLEALGYGTVIIRMDSASYTGQSRQRDYIVGLYQASGQSVRGLFPHCPDGAGRYTTRLETREIIPALTTHRTRYDSRDCYVWDTETERLRILDGEEREAFAGFPPGWTFGLSEAAYARVYGNSVNPYCAHDIARVLRGVHSGGA